MKFTRSTPGRMAREFVRAGESDRGGQSLGRGRLSDPEALPPPAGGRAIRSRLANCDASSFDSWLEDAHIQGVVDRHLPIPYPFVEEAIRRTGVVPGKSEASFREKFRGESKHMLRASVPARAPRPDDSVFR